MPFHINADFFPSNDRKHVILGDDYQSQWNREALQAAAIAVGRATPQLTTMLGAERFWHLASSLNLLSQNTARDGRDGVWQRFWEALQKALRKEAVVVTSSGDWISADSGVALLQQREETDNIAVLEGLGNQAGGREPEALSDVAPLNRRPCPQRGGPVFSTRKETG